MQMIEAHREQAILVIIGIRVGVRGVAGDLRGDPRLAEIANLAAGRA
jgi:hypothetical protein